MNVFATVKSKSNAEIKSSDRTDIYGPRANQNIRSKTRSARRESDRSIFSCYFFTIICCAFLLLRVIVATSCVVRVRLNTSRTYLFRNGGGVQITNPLDKSITVRVNDDKNEYVSPNSSDSDSERRAHDIVTCSSDEYKGFPKSSLSTDEHTKKTDSRSDV